ncbi:malonyl-CoA-acyl carrier protein transacylase, mitochondrial-like [Rhopilema esculentum]|uniref:malonyl-CoA-acyl carrier protein transacylase, mitochondrial-like n=1 Tax=Rhopilema esculentum TaxID=499914 RepID=UPI0031DADFCF
MFLRLTRNGKFESIIKTFKRYNFIGKEFDWFGKPSETTKNVILCSGQGFQYVGMFQNLERENRLTEPMVELMKIANSVLEYDIVRLCVEGPKSKLDKTVQCQPAVTLANLVGSELMKKGKPWIFETYPKIAGYSVGEIAALHLAGSITVHQAFSITKARAEAMQRASELTASVLFFVHGLSKDDLQQKCDMIFEKNKGQKPKFNTFIGIAIDSYPKGHVVGATVDCAKDILELSTDKIEVTELPVSGAFHTPLMEPAQEILYKTLEKMDIKMPKYDLFSNVTGEVYKSPEEIKSLLVRQIAEPVQWQAIAQQLYKKASTTRTCELGAGNQLKGMFAKYNRKILRKYFSYSV